MSHSNKQTYHDQFDVSLCDLSKCYFAPSFVETRQCQDFRSPQTHYATGLALHISTVLKQLPVYVTSPKPNIVALQLLGGGGDPHKRKQKKNKKSKNPPLIIKKPP